MGRKWAKTGLGWERKKIKREEREMGKKREVKWKRRKMGGKKGEERKGKEI